MKTHVIDRSLRRIFLPSASAILLTALIWGAGAARGQAQTLLDGGFENPTVPMQASGGGTDWTPSGSVFITNNAMTLGRTIYGAQWLQLNSFNAADAQTISSGFSIGSTYTFSIAASDVGNGAGDQLTITISGGATASQAFSIPTRTATGDNDFTFANASLDFTPASAGPITFTIANTGAGPGPALAVDNAQIQLVPEPSSLASLFGALAALIGVRRWRGRERGQRLTIAV
ncbi:MAG: PEP-CTERM sorting domain-containing protein [Chthoniobacter sp.]|nr:PEP-CTERM sorting domain-containing protein [Chthoniobacter sp.]